MWIERTALALEIPAAATLDTRQLCEWLASLGFPVDGVTTREGCDVLDVDITANRGDVMSHRGMAREIAAKLHQPLTPIEAPDLLEGAPVLEVRLESPACPIYSTAILELGTGTTPLAVQTLLLALESTPKRLPAVDASNELLHRYGHPTHAFDADRIRGTVSVRWAEAGETLVTLDGVARVLVEQDLVIADEAGPIALAGVMGGDGTKVNEATRRVLLESAWFDAKTVRATARRHSLHTDASHRFGRGADPHMAIVARNLLAGRLQTWCGATMIGAWTAGSSPAGNPSVTLTGALLARVAGEPLSLMEGAEALRSLGCTVIVEGEGLEVSTPSWRHDLLIPEDLAEEILRLRGYQHIPSVLPPMAGPPEPLSSAYLQRQRLSRRLAQLGFHQTVTYGFISSEMDATFAAPGNAVEGRTLANPLGQEFSVMRSSLLPSLRAAAEQNFRQGSREVRLFELAPTYLSGSKGPVEHFKLGIIWGGTLGGEDYLSPARAVREADLRGVAQDLGVGRPRRGQCARRGTLRHGSSHGGPAPGRGPHHPGLPSLQPLPLCRTGPIPSGGPGSVSPDPGDCHEGGASRRHLTGTPLCGCLPPQEPSGRPPGLADANEVPGRANPCGRRGGCMGGGGPDCGGIPRSQAPGVRWA